MNENETKQQSFCWTHANPAWSSSTKLIYNIRATLVMLKMQS